jgi:hypothetical protein
MYYRHGDLVTEAFVAGYQVLYETVKENPELRRVPIDRLDAVREGLNALGYSYRTRYRGPHKPQHDTLKKDARAFTIYFKEDPWIHYTVT